MMSSDKHSLPSLPPPLPPAPEKERSSLWATALRIAAYPISLIAGYFTGDLYVRNEVRTDIGNSDAVASMRARLKTSPMLEVLNESSTSGTEAAGKVKEAYGEFNKELDTRMTKWGFTNIRRYWDVLDNGKKLETAALALTVSTVLLGGILTIANALPKVRFSGKDNDHTTSR